MIIGVARLTNRDKCVEGAETLDTGGGVATFRLQLRYEFKFLTLLSFGVN